MVNYRTHFACEMGDLLWYSCKPAPSILSTQPSLYDPGNVRTFIALHTLSVRRKQQSPDVKEDLEPWFVYEA